MPDQAQDVLADPSSHTVEQVVAALDASDPDSDQVERVKAVEREGKGRRGVLEWEPQRAEPVFSTDEKLGPAAWRERSGWFTVGSRRITPHAIAGALADVDPGDELTQAQVQDRLEAFLEREV